MVNRNRSYSGEPSLALLVLVFGLMVIGAAWHFVVREWIPIHHRFDMWALLREHWAYRHNFAAYLPMRWPPLIAVHYPYYFTAAVFPGALFYGVALAPKPPTSSYFRNLLTCFCQAAAGWLIGAGIGWVLSLFPLPHLLLKAFAMPVAALLGGACAPACLASALTTQLVRGTSITRHKGNRDRATKRALQRGRTAFAGVLLDSEAETRHFAAIGITGSGKSTALRELMYTATQRGDRHIVADPDAGAMSVFYRQGDVILNPFDQRSAKWDLLAEIREESDYRFIAESVLPYTGARDHDQWVGYAQQIFSACLRTWHENALGSSDAFLTTLATASTDKIAALCEGASAQRYFESGNERMLGGVMSTLAPALDNIQWLARLEGAPFSVRRWLSEGHGSLWMPYKANQIAALRGLVACWMRLAIFEGLSLAPSQARRLWYYLDELDALGRIEGLKDAQARLRKFGGCVVMGFQSIAQVRAVYGDADAKTIIENCGNKLILRCEESEGGGTARFASELIGEREIARSEISYSYVDGERSPRTELRSTRQQTEQAVLPSEMMQLPDCTGYLKVATRPHWMRVSFDYLRFKTVTEAYLPAERGIRAGAPNNPATPSFSSPLHQE